MDIGRQSLLLLLRVKVAMAPPQSACPPGPQLLLNTERGNPPGPESFKLLQIISETNKNPMSIQLLRNCTCRSFVGVRLLGVANVVATTVMLLSVGHVFVY